MGTTRDSCSYIQTLLTSNLGAIAVEGVALSMIVLDSWYNYSITITSAGTANRPQTDIGHRLGVCIEQLGSFKGDRGDI